MPNVAVMDMAGKKVEEMTLSDAVFGIAAQRSVMHMADCRLPGQSALWDAVDAYKV